MSTLTLGQAITMVDSDDAIYYDYLVVKECACGEFEVIESYNLMLEMDYIDKNLPVTRIDSDYENFVYVKEQYVCSNCSYVYEFPEELAAYKCFIEYVCDLYKIEIPHFYVDHIGVTRATAAGSFHKSDYSVYIPARSLSVSVITMTEILVHELRHAWQCVYHKDILDYHHSQSYYERDCEKDAYSFTSKYQDTIVHSYICKNYDDSLYKRYSLYQYRANNDIGQNHCDLIMSLINKDLFLDPVVER